MLERLIKTVEPDLTTKQCEDWARGIVTAFPIEASLAIQSPGESILVSALCDRYQKLPRTTTRREFLEEGIRLGGALQSQHAIFTAVTIADGQLLVEEAGGHRAAELDRYAEELETHRLAPFKMCPPIGRLRQWASMQRYTQTLHLYPKPMPHQVVSKLLTQMLCALQFLHSKRLMHMDVKPSNIMHDASGFWLADFGSVTREGSNTEHITMAYVPTDRRTGPVIASPSFDYWQLAVSAAEMLVEPEARPAGHGAGNLSTAQVLEELAPLTGVEGVDRLLALLQ